MTSDVVDYSVSVDERLNQILATLPEPIGTGSRRIVSAGGKRLRPELVMRCADLSPGTEKRDERHDSKTLTAAVAVELLHSATLLHDDLLDESETRRGVAAVHVREGTHAAVIGGDALIAQSWKCIAQVGALEAQDLADALSDMCSGEVLEAELAYDLTADAASVMQVAALKTGSLMSAACRIGGRRAVLSEDQIDRLGAFGMDFGIALQLIDDVLDVVSNADVLGKPCGGDFAAGLMTMPMVYAMAETSDESTELGKLFTPGADGLGSRSTRELLIGSGGVGETVALAENLARRAAESLKDLLPDDGSNRLADLLAMPSAYVKAQLTNKVSPELRDQVLDLFQASAGGNDLQRRFSRIQSTVESHESTARIA